MVRDILGTLVGNICGEVGAKKLLLLGMQPQGLLAHWCITYLETGCEWSRQILLVMVVGIHLCQFVKLDTLPLIFANIHQIGKYQG